MPSAASSSSSSPPMDLQASPAAEPSLTAALTALQVSLGRDLRAFLPPTPVASPVHCPRPSSKRSRFDFELDWATASDDDAIVTPAKKPKPAAVAPTVFVSMSAQLQRELARQGAAHRQRPSDQALRARKRRSQLSYFAIAGAFHRAALEREQATAAQAVE